MNTYIEIDRLRVRACHGVGAQERTVGNDFEVSALLHVDFAGCNDTIEDTVSYADVVQEITGAMGTPRQLLETVALDIQRRITGRWPQIEGGRLKVTKLHPPMTPSAPCSAIIEW